MKKTLVTAAVAGVATLGFGSPAFAQDSLTLNPTEVTAGGTLSVTWNCEFGDADELTTTAPGVTLDPAKQDQTVTVPASVPASGYMVTLKCFGGGTLDSSFTVLAAPTPPSPSATAKPKPSGAPKTGGGFSQQDNGMMLGAGALAAAGLLGAGLVVLRRRYA